MRVMPPLVASFPRFLSTVLRTPVQRSFVGSLRRTKSGRPLSTTLQKEAESRGLSSRSVPAWLPSFDRRRRARGIDLPIDKESSMHRAHFVLHLRQERPSSSLSVDLLPAFH